MKTQVMLIETLTSIQNAAKPDHQLRARWMRAIIASTNGKAENTADQIRGLGI
jgi:hypothetical protein